MADHRFDPSRDFTMHRPLFRAGLVFFGLGLLGGTFLDSASGADWALPLDALSILVFLVVALAVQFLRLSLARATSILIYLAAVDFGLVVVHVLAVGGPHLDVQVYNNLFLLALFLGLSTFLIGKSAALVFGGLILVLLVAAAGRWTSPTTAQNLWFEVPGVVGCSLVLYRYRASLDRLVADLKRVIRENRTLRDRERLASLGELTAGIAHEIKNPVNLVVNFAESSSLLLDDLETLWARPDPTDQERHERTYLLRELRQNLLDIRAQGLRGSDILASMLLHARSTGAPFQPVDLNLLAAESLQLAYLGQPDRHLHAEVRHRFEPSGGPVFVMGDRGELSRALVNLCSNGFWSASRRAETAAKGYMPQVSVSVSADGDEARILVSDNGLGFDEAVRAQLFVPFFTTKPLGEGTGLGLSLAREVVADRHRGRIEAEGNPGVGAWFLVVLPRIGGAS